MHLFFRHSNNQPNSSVRHPGSHFGQGIRHSGIHLGRNLVTPSKKSAGFTLIEVLIASVILFSALAITAELYSASSLSAQKASEKARFYQISPIAMNAIKSEVRQLSEDRRLSQFSSEFSISGVSYSWQAERVAFVARATDYNDIEPPREQFGLFLVNVLATTKKNNMNKSTGFQFKVTTW